MAENGYLAGTIWLVRAVMYLTLDLVRYPMLATVRTSRLADRRLGEAIRTNVGDGELAASIWRAFRSQPRHLALAPPLSCFEAAPGGPGSGAKALAHDLHCLVALCGSGGGGWARRWLTPTRLAWAKLLGDWPAICRLFTREPAEAAAMLHACGPALAWAPKVRPATRGELERFWARFEGGQAASRAMRPAQPKGDRSLGAWHLSAARALASPGPAAPAEQLMTWVRRCPAAAAYG